MTRFGTVTIVGVGLIGGSIGKSLREQGIADEVVGVGRDHSRLALAQSLGAVDSFTTRFEEAIPRSRVVVICTPVDRIASDILRCEPFVHDDLLITDAGSTKFKIVDALSGHPALARHVVCAHPIAGSEKSGVEAARANLFARSLCVLTPTDSTPLELCDLARKFWSSVGCHVETMAPRVHDEVLAQMSHVPHVLAAALARSVPASSLPFGGGAFRDMTRVAAADPSLWTSILLQNREAVLQTLDLYLRNLDDFRRLLDSADSEDLNAWWHQAKAQRGLFERAHQQLSDQPKLHSAESLD